MCLPLSHSRHHRPPHTTAYPRLRRSASALRRCVCLWRHSSRRRRHRARAANRRSRFVCGSCEYPLVCACRAVSRVHAVLPSHAQRPPTSMIGGQRTSIAPLPTAAARGKLPPTGIGVLACGGIACGVRALLTTAAAACRCVGTAGKAPPMQRQPNAASVSPRDPSQRDLSPRDAPSARARSPVRAAVNASSSGDDIRFSTKEEDESRQPIVRAASLARIVERLTFEKCVCMRSYARCVSTHSSTAVCHSQIL